MNINPLLSISAYLPLNENLLTSGQPTADQFVALAQAGVELVVDLGQHQADDRSEAVLEDAAHTVEALGMRYLSIPVRWRGPACGPLHRFFGVMREHGEKKILIYCGENQSVSVFIFLWRVVVRGWNGPQAWEELLKIWQPNAVWQTFIDQELSDNDIMPISGAGAKPG